MHGGGLNFILGSIPNGADPMVEWFFLFSEGPPTYLGKARFFAIINNFSNKASMTITLIPKLFVRYCSPNLQLKVSVELLSLASCRVEILR